MLENSSSKVWERVGDWSVMRPFVYYQRENFVPEGLVEGRDVIDYSAGLGDLSIHVSSLGPSSLIATAPERHAPRPSLLPDSVEWRTGVGAGRIADVLPEASADVILAHMVIQFPTVEGDAVDVDGILRQMRGVARETAGLIELVRYLDLPPREGPFGRTGFGLKIPMLVNSFVREGFTIDSVEEIEPFTFPIGLRESIAESTESVVELGEHVMAIKHRYLTSVEAADPYLRPAVLKAMIGEIRRLLPVTAVPIVRICATKT